MEIIFESYRKTKHLHHAYLIESDDIIVLEKITSFVEKDVGLPVQGNPDVWIREFDKFGIDEGRMLRTLQAGKSVSGTKRFFVLTSRFFTREAQNALLKVFEEPTENTHFFIITPRADALLPTLKSRLYIISREEISEKKDTQDIDATAREFLSADVAGRLKAVENIVKEKDKAASMEMLDALERELVAQDGFVLAENTQVVDDIIKSRGYLYGNAPSVKMIWEHLSLTLPRVA